MADWDKRKEELMKEYMRQKAGETLVSWSKQRCTEVNKAGKIKVNTDILTYEGAPQGPLAMLEHKYEPCAGRGLF